VGEAGAQRVRRTPAPVPPPSLLARARAHAVGAPDASSANQTRVSTPPHPRPRRHTQAHVHAQTTSATRGTPPTDARREGARLSRCHGGASRGERRGRSGRVQLDVGAGGVQRGYGRRHGVGLVLLRMRMRLLLRHSVEAPSGWDPGDVTLQEDGLLSQRPNIRVQEARVVVSRWQFSASLFLTYSSC
jgi:hypothetical protein